MTPDYRAGFEAAREAAAKVAEDGGPDGIDAAEHIRALQPEAVELNDEEWKANGCPRAISVEDELKAEPQTNLRATAEHIQKLREDRDGWRARAEAAEAERDRLKDELAAFASRNVDEEIRITIRDAGREVVAARERAREAEARLAEVETQKNGAYSERNQCVALIARMALKLGWRVSVGRHPDLDVDWEDDWRTLLFVDLPTGQATWHFQDRERPLLEGLPEAQQKWDGHDTPEKYRRVNAALKPQPGEPKEEKP